MRIAREGWPFIAGAWILTVAAALLWWPLAVLLAILAIWVACLSAPAQEPHPILPVGSPAPDFALPGIDGQIHKLADYKGSPFLMVMFICNHCPTSQLYEGRIKRLADDYSGKGVAFVAIQPNDPKAILLSELGYTDVSDSFDEMKIRAAHRHFNFPYLYDATQAVAKAYRAACTPDFYLFDKDHRLIYRGQFDDSRPSNGLPVTGKDLREALDAALTGKPLPSNQKPSIGCSIKWKPGNKPEN